jgi:hypothetical protein
MKNYLVLIGDVIDSRKLENRPEFQKQFAAVLHEVQNRIKAITVSPLTVTIGDEFQAVFHSASGLFEACLDLQIRLLPVRLRFGLGLGAVSTALNQQQAIGMDGPAFHSARQAIEKARQTKSQFRLEPEDLLSAVALGWVNDHIKDWKKERWQVLLGLSAGNTQRRLAAETGISQPAVSQMLRREAFSLILETFRATEAMLNQKLGEN